MEGWAHTIIHSGIMEHFVVVRDLSYNNVLNWIEITDMIRDSFVCV